MNEFEIEQQELLEEQARLQQDADAAQGALEAVGEYLSGSEPYELPEAQSRLVEAMREYKGHNPESEIVAIASSIAAVEGFSDTLRAIGRSGIKSLVSTIPQSLKNTSLLLTRYSDVSKKLLIRLRSLREEVWKEKDSAAKHAELDLGAHKRYLQSDGREITNIDDFFIVFNRHIAFANYAYIHGVGFTSFVADRLLKDFQQLQNASGKDLRDDLRKSIAYHWGNVYKDGFRTNTPGQVPIKYKKDNADCRVYPVCALFDARVVVATEPSRAKDLTGVGKYRAVLVQDTSKSINPKGVLALSGICGDILPMLDKSISLLNDMHYYGELAKKCDKLTREFSSSAKAILASIDNGNNRAIESAISYMTLANTCTSMMTSPHVAMAWMHMRLCVVVAAIAERYLGGKDNAMSVAKQYFNTDNSGVGLESYLDTSALLATVLACKSEA